MKIRDFELSSAIEIVTALISFEINSEITFYVAKIAAKLLNKWYLMDI